MVGRTAEKEDGVMVSIGSFPMIVDAQPEKRI